MLHMCGICHRCPGKGAAVEHMLLLCGEDGTAFSHTSSRDACDWCRCSTVMRVPMHLPPPAGFDPLGYMKGDENSKAVLKVKEIKNARLAMLAFAGFVAQVIANGSRRVGMQGRSQACAVPDQRRNVCNQCSV